MMSRGPSLSLAHQAFALRRIFPEGTTSIRRISLAWTGILTPTPLSRDYTVRVTYSLRTYPRVVIIDPPLVPDENGLLPHFYREGSLCLHEAHEWDRSMLIVDTTIPWATEWLAHYELWKWSGQWYGERDSAAEAMTTMREPRHDNGAGTPPRVDGTNKTQFGQRMATAAAPPGVG